jgi:hypothetical protein
VPHYQPGSAHDLSTKSAIPHQFKFQIHTWSTGFTHNYKVEDYVNAVISKSFVANFLSQKDVVEFKMRLSEMLEQNGYTRIVKEKYSLTVLFAKPG